MKAKILVASVLGFLLAQPRAAAALQLDPTACSEMEAWGYSSGMCTPLPMPGMSMKMIMAHYNSFFTQTLEQAPRGRDAFSIPNMFMVDVGSSVGERQYLNVDFMGTLEYWTFPSGGYPELLQIGEENREGQPYLDAQHPHSSPVMGLTFSDTIALPNIGGGAKDRAKIWFAPRGQTSDGPIAFMHRATGLMNPDAPLGHHIGQDAGHISSTVLGASLSAADNTLEFSTFNGTEPEPSKIDLPLANPNSYALRLTRALSPHSYAMASAAFVKDPELHESTVDHVWRYSASVYNTCDIAGGWILRNTFIYGLINFYDRVSALTSLAEEFWLQKEKNNIWGRIEHLQRTPRELQIASDSPDDFGNDPRWVSAVTAGYTRQLFFPGWSEVGAGVSVTNDFLPPGYRSVYGGNPVSGKFFIQIGGMQMWEM